MPKTSVKNNRNKADNINQIIDLIYTSPAHPETWNAVLDQIAENVDAVGSLISVHRKDKWIGWRCSQIFEPVASKHLQNHMHHTGIIQSKLFSRNSPGFVPDHLVFSDEEFRETAFMKEFARELNLHRAAATIIHVPNGDIILFSTHRQESKPCFDEEDINWLDNLRPHLARAALLSVQWGFQRMQASLDGIGMIGLPAAILNENRKAILSNNHIRDYDRFIQWYRDDRIEFKDRSSNELLLNVTNSAREREKFTPVSIPIRSVDGEAAVAHLLPVTAAYKDIFDWESLSSERFESACISMIVTPVSSVQGTDHALLRGLFDLTTAETKVAEAIVQGLSVSQVSEKLKISSETVRSHLKSIFAKTGVGRQAQLVSLLSGVSKIPIN